MPIKSLQPFSIKDNALQNSIIKAQSRNITRIGYEIEEKALGFIPIATKDDEKVSIEFSSEVSSPQIVDCKGKE